MKDSTKDVPAYILVLFQNLKHLTITESPADEYRPLSIYGLPLSDFYSSTITLLCINVYYFADCLSILDCCFKQLSTFIVQVHRIENVLRIRHNMVSSCYFIIDPS